MRRAVISAVCVALAVPLLVVHPGVLSGAVFGLCCLCFGFTLAASFILD